MLGLGSETGTLELRCSDEGDATEVFPQRDIGGPLAMVSAAAGISTCAVTVEQHRGGEGYVDVQHRSWAFDVDSYRPSD